MPMAGKPTFDLGDDEMEIGVGIHGEPGRERRPLATAREIVETLAAAVVDDLPFASGDQVLAFVNGMGGTPLMELYVVYAELHRFLEERGIAIARNLVGSYMTSLDMAGCSITLLRLDDELTRAVGRAGGHARPAVGRVSAAAVHGRRGGRHRLAARVRGRGRRAARRADRARRGHRRRRPRRQHGPRDAGGGGEAGADAGASGARRRTAPLGAAASRPSA